MELEQLLAALNAWAARFGNEGPPLGTPDSALWDAFMSYSVSQEEAAESDGGSSVGAADTP